MEAFDGYSETIRSQTEADSENYIRRVSSYFYLGNYGRIISLETGGADR